MQRSKTSPCWQVPKNLEERDIQEAFEDIGRVTKCEAPNTGHLAFNTDFVLLHADAFAQLILFICRAVVWLFLFVWILSHPCQVERGVAIITFANSSHAKKARRLSTRLLGYQTK